MIGIISIYDDLNFGNRLQNYAMYKILSIYQETYTIKRRVGCERTKVFSYYIKQKIKESINYNNEKIKAKRKKAFHSFDKNIQFGENISSSTNFIKLNKKYDFFVAGSDQIWNPEFFNDMYINMLGFASSYKKVAISPSIGIEVLSETQKNEFKKYLPSFAFLSSRELSGSYLIEKELGLKCETLIDPTLMLKPEEWEKVEKKPTCLKNENYLFVYLLGDNSSIYRKTINEIAIKNNLEIVNINDDKTKFYFCGPSEFIYLIHHANIVLTDSYHATIFSILFKKRIKIFSRNDNGKYSSMNSRFITLSKLLSIDKKFFIDNESVFINSFDEITIDNDKLQNEKNKFRHALDTYLKE